jgi:Kef-type K+ transport system membrane component KefB
MMLNALRTVWESLQDRLYFMPPFPDRADPLALFSLLLVSGLVFGEFLHRRTNLPRIVGYVIAGTLFGPSLLGWITVESLAVARPLADTALGLLLLEIGRRLDLRWLRRNPALLRTAAAEASLSFLAIFGYATLLVGLSPAWGGAAAAITMASAPAVVLLTAEETRAQGQVAMRTVLFTSLNCAVSFVVFAVVLGLIHGEHSEDWLNAIVHPLWVSLGALAVGTFAGALCLLIARHLPKASLAQVFVLVAVALLAVGIARMIAVPVFLSLFLMGAAIAYLDRSKTLAYTDLPQGHWLLAIVLFVITGATLPWRDFTLVTGLQALGLLAVRAVAKLVGVLFVGSSDLSRDKRLLVGLGIQPLSATAVFMTMELATLYPEVGRPALALPLFAAALMEFAGPILCKVAFVQAGETEEGRDRSGGIG